MMMSTRSRGETFIITKEHRRFVEFANAVRQDRYIGLCFGAAGVGKTLSAHRYADWNHADPDLVTGLPEKRSNAKIYKALAQTRTLFFTPSVSASPHRLRGEMEGALYSANECIDRHIAKADPYRRTGVENHIELVIIDEVERLSMSGLELVRELFDHSGFGLMLSGMPGIEKRMARYPQLYSRVGFAHHYRPLQGDELSFILTRHWQKLGLHLDGADFTDAQALAAIARITGGNFRLLHRLFVQIERVLRINKRTVITDDVVNAARSTLVIGAN